LRSHTKAAAEAPALETVTEGEQAGGLLRTSTQQMFHFLLLLRAHVRAFTLI
jgi:hypothetical protein